MHHTDVSRHHEPPRGRRARGSIGAVVATAILAAGLGVAGVGTEAALSPSTPPAAADPVPGGLGLTAINPCRVADSRTATPQGAGTGGRRTDGTTWQVQVGGTGAGFAAQGGNAGGCAVPDGAAAVEVSITAVDPIGDGFLRAFAAGGTAPTATFVNYTSAVGITNTGTVPLAASGTLDLAIANFGGQTHLVVDVQGYYTAGGTLGYTPLLPPCRAVDTRGLVGEAGEFGSGLGRGFRMTGANSMTFQGGPAGGCGVPNGVTAVEVSVTAVNTAANGFLRALPHGVPSSTPGAFVNFTAGTSVTNTGTVRLQLNGQTDLVVFGFGGPTDVLVDIQGYFSTAPSAARYQTVTPCRVLDTRNVGGPAGTGGRFPDGVTRHIQTSGASVNYRSQGGSDPTGCGVPHRAVAIEASLTAVSPSASGFTRPYPVGASPTGTFLNLSTGRSITNTGSLALGKQGMDDLAIKHFGGNAHYLLDVFGYFEGNSLVFPTAETADAGRDHTCALGTDLGAWCWGNAGDGRLGGGGSPAFINRSDPGAVLVGPSTTMAGEVAQVSAGASSACALLIDTTIRCWGSDSSGQLGDTSAGGFSSLATFVRRQGLNNIALPVSGFVQVAVGGAHACALSTTGTVSCWGENGKGQLGTTDTNDASSPRVVNTSGSTLTNVVQVVAGDEHTCALIADGTARCWGSSAVGQLGIGSGGPGTFKFVPQTVVSTPSSTTPLGGVVELAAGGANTCALTVDGAVRCWGSNESGQLLFPSDSDLHPANRFGVQFLSDGGGGTVSITVSNASGLDQHACALLANGTARCWGANQSGQLGRGVTSTEEFQASAVLSTGNNKQATFAELTAGGRHTCGIQTGSGAGLQCWGDDSSGQLGVDGALPNRVNPTPVVSF